MAQSFTAAKAGPLSARRDAGNARRTVLVTGAAGNIGSYFCEHSHDRYDLVMVERTIDDEDAQKVKPFGRLERGDITDLERMKELCRGADAVVHLAADPSPNTTWDSGLQLNIVGTYNMFVAAKAAGVRRFVYASSIHAVSGYPADYQVHTDDPVNPGDLYGVTKSFGEALGRYMAEKEGLSTICLRIGAFQPREKAADPEKGVAMLDAWVSRRDLTQLIQKCIDNETLQFAVFHGLSNNRFKRLDITDARELVGYDPQDDLTEVNPKLKDLDLRETVPSHSMADDSQKSGLREDLPPAPGRAAGDKGRDEDSGEKRQARAKS